jgi:hypothetical protein
MKKLLLTALIASSMFFNVACTDEEVTASAIGIGLAVGIAAGGSHHDDRHDDHYRYHGGYDHEGYDHGGRRCDRGRCIEAASSVADASAANFAAKHDISIAAAAKVQQAFDNVSVSGLSSFQAIGLNQDALQSIMNLNVPDSSSVNAMARSLEISPAKSQQLLQSLVAEFQASAANGQSAYWQACQAKGQWKTPQNANCSSSAWNGCSPETGATVCY